MRGISAYLLGQLLEARDILNDRYLFTTAATNPSVHVRLIVMRACVELNQAAVAPTVTGALMPVTNCIAPRYSKAAPGMREEH
jgi:hypothetical protein